MKKLKESFFIVLSLFFFGISINSYSIDELKEVTPLQMAGILIEERSFLEAEQLLEMLTKKEKESFDYYYLSGKIAAGKDENEKAIKFYKKAYEKNSKNITVRFNLLKIYVKDKKYKRLMKKELKEISEMDMTPEERADFNSLRDILLKKDQKNYLLSLSTGLVATDNVNETKDSKKSDTFTDTRLTFAHQKKLNEQLSLTSFLSYGNRMFMDVNEKNSHDFYIGIEPAKVISTWQVSTPLSLNYNIENNKKTSNGYSLGIKGVKKILTNSMLSTGVDSAYTNSVSSDYKGIGTTLYSGINWQGFSEIKFSTKLKLETTSYDEDTENYLAYGGNISGEKLLAAKYLIRTGYDITFKNYKKDRKDLTHSLKLNMESNIGSSKWKYNLGYALSANDSDSSTNEYIKNEISLKIKRDFN